ncbi:MAG: acyl-CoA dehydrogenase [Actinobacteria bacterium]|jgi:alkylation response protein AidB-like acyl-CoA dehydrogenase|nr:MAG: acyl-CoA dehydrogenase [Actinomycetota bacterium]
MRTIDDFSLPLEYTTPLLEPLGNIVRDWAEREVIPFRREYDEDWKDHRLILPAMDKLLGVYGLQRFLWPEDLGGWGMGKSNYFYVAVYRLVEEMARADSGMCVAIGVVLWPIVYITVEPHVNRRLCEEFAPMFCQTDRAVFSCMAMTEPQGGSDIENVELLKGSTIQTTAVKDGDEWVINGHKLWPTNTGGVADLMAVICTTNPGSDDPGDIAVIFVPADRPGVTQGEAYEKAGMAADKNGDIWFENVRVPLWYRAHGPGDDAKYYGEIVASGNMGTIAMAAGVMLNIYEKLGEYTSSRIYRGKPLKENDAVAGALSDLAATIEAVRMIGYQAARMLDRPELYGDRWSPEVVAKIRAHRYFAVDRCLEVADTAMNLMEACGADRELDVEKHWRDLKMLQLWLGGKQLCQMEVARWFYACETL